jgi:hypothetical protein
MTWEDYGGLGRILSTAVRHKESIFHMRSIYKTGILFILSFSNYSQAQEGQSIAPFEIPPSGKPGLLIGNIELEAPTAMAFDSQNRPYLINNRNPKSFGLIQTMRDGRWETLSCLNAIKGVTLPVKRNMGAPGELVIDDADCLYATIAGRLVYSPDLGKTFQAYPCQGSLELRVGPQPLATPPAICQITNYRNPYIASAKWARLGTLSVILPEKTKDGLKLGDPILITNKCLVAGSGGHSGGTSFAVTVGQYTHLVYTEMPKTSDGGNPIYIATIDRKTRSVIATQFLVNAEPKKPDVHTRPTIAADSKGYLHVVSGSHGEPFYYLRSRKPNDITGGWTAPVQMGGRQCYASLVCDDQDRLHSVFREWLPHASLGYQSKAAVDGEWAASRTLVHGALKRDRYEYGIFYHRLFIDRASTLYLSFTFFEFGTGDEGDYPEALAVSNDRGKSWQLADKKTFDSRQLGKKSKEHAAPSDGDKPAN